MKVLIVGSGAAEHALAWRLSVSESVDEVVVAPGNGGTSAVGRNAPVIEDDPQAVLAVARREKPDLVVVGSEIATVLGAADVLGAEGFAVVAPSRRAARLQASRVWAKCFLVRHGIPTAPFHVSSRFEDAAALVRISPVPLMIRTSGLTDERGGALAWTVRDAEEILRRFMVERRCNGAGDEVLIETRLDGHSASLVAFVDATTLVTSPLVADYERYGEGGQGPDAGGLGCATPPPWLGAGQEEAVLERIVRPVVAALRAEGIEYRGILRFDLILTVDGPWVVSFGTGFGDPQAQALLPRLCGDLGAILLALAQDRLGVVPVTYDDRASCAVVLTSRGGAGEVGVDVPVPLLPEGEGLLVFHGATARCDDGTWRSHGERVLTVVGHGECLAVARERVYAVLSEHDVAAFHHRRDVGR